MALRSMPACSPSITSRHPEHAPDPSLHAAPPGALDRSGLRLRSGTEGAGHRRHALGLGGVRGGGALAGAAALGLHRAGWHRGGPLGLHALLRSTWASADPGAIVWDEVLGLLADPVAGRAGAAGWASLGSCCGLFRFFDAAKPGPVAWADGLVQGACRVQPIGWRQGLGIMFDDLVAALCALLVLALVGAARDRGVLATLFA
jgi:hypothetical protein